jgi:arsenate reductase (thioredoxin)
MADRPYNVLFLCTGNSARSIMAEALINQWGRGKFRGFSAGSRPKGEVHPIALELLKKMNFPTESLRSKGWNEFAAPGALALDFVFTVCDNAAGEVCPYWPGQPMTAHWGVPDPAAVEGSEVEQWLAFRSACHLTLLTESSCRNDWIRSVRLTRRPTQRNERAPTRVG